jgi:hypothetical protein
MPQYHSKSKEKTKPFEINKNNNKTFRSKINRIKTWEELINYKLKRGGGTPLYKALFIRIVLYFILYLLFFQLIFFCLI